MGLFQAIARLIRPEIELSALADEIADCTFEAAWQRVNGQILALAPAEARGYIRARGAILLQGKTVKVAEQYGVLSIHRSQLYALATEALIQRVQVHARMLLTQQTARRAA